MSRLFAVMIVGVLLLAACGTQSDTLTETTTDLLPLSAMGPGISVEEALLLDSTEPVLINEFLFMDSNGQVILASLMAESLPSCGAWSSGRRVARCPLMRLIRV